MGRRRVEVEVVFLDILPVIAFAVGQPEEAFLEDRVPAVPQGQGKAQPLFVVGYAGQAVLSPTVGPRACLIVGEEIPGVAPLAVVLANSPPLPLGQVGSPFLPGNILLPRFFKSDLFRGHKISSFLQPKRRPSMYRVLRLLGWGVDWFRTSKTKAGTLFNLRIE